MSGRPDNSAELKTIREIQGVKWSVFKVALAIFIPVGLALVGSISGAYVSSYNGDKEIVKKIDHNCDRLTKLETKEDSYKADVARVLSRLDKYDLTLKSQSTEINNIRNEINDLQIGFIQEVSRNMNEINEKNMKRISEQLEKYRAMGRVPER